MKLRKNNVSSTYCNDRVWLFVFSLIVIIAGLNTLRFLPRKSYPQVRPFMFSYMWITNVFKVTKILSRHARNTGKFVSGRCYNCYITTTRKVAHKMDTLNRIQAEQAIARKIAHEKAMAKSPWIRESVQAFRNATPEQLAEVEAYRKRVYGF
jgi:hypothetical protein